MPAFSPRPRLLVRVLLISLEDSLIVNVQYLLTDRPLTSSLVWRFVPAIIYGLICSGLSRFCGNGRLSTDGWS
jgi:hypothetical protein